MSDDPTAAWYTANPLADAYAREQPGRFVGKSATQAPPKLFAGGTQDVPTFTASGIDPQALLRLPYGLRHAAAEEPDITKVFAIFENYSGMPEARIDSPGLAEAEARVRQWFDETPDMRPAEVVAAETQAEYDNYRRSTAADALLPEERQQQREQAWAAKQAARQTEADARGRAAQARADKKFWDAQPAHVKADAARRALR